MNRIKSRTYFIGSFVALLFIFIVKELYTIQIVKHDHFTFLAKNQQNVSVEVEAQRGSIFDRNGKILAFTRNEITFQIDKVAFAKLKKYEKDSLFARLAHVFGKSKQHYLSLINQSVRRNVVIEKSVPLHKSFLMSDFVNSALKREIDNSRVYPNGTSAAHLLGYLNKDNFAENGIEKEYNSILKGQNGILVKKRNAKQRILGIDEESSIFPIKGNDIVLTIDIDYQKILEKSMKEGIDKFGGNSAVGIIQNPETGEILALANLPTYDPNSFNEFDANNLKNRAVADVYEPGSVIKSFTMAGLLENGIINGNEIINTENGVCTINGAKFVDEHSYSQLTSVEILQHSSNVGMAKLSDRIENGKFYKNMRDFGFGIKSNVDLPSEISGNLKTPDDFSGVSKYYMAVGYELLATPIQIVTGYSALVNGGKLLKPYILKEILGNDGIKTKPEIIRNVISEKTSTKLKKWLVGVVDDGTGKAAKVANLSIGGKTGTAKILVNKHYQSRNNNTTFVGFFPAEKPKIVCYIWVSSPKNQFFGGTVAAPIFQDVVSNLVTLFPELGSNKQQNTPQSYQEMFAQSQKSSGNLMRTANVGDDKKTTFANENNIRTLMPNLVGKSKKEVVSILSPIGVNFSFKGIGTVKSQSVQPGTPLKKGISIVLDCNR